jgi:hypothetical protein
MVIFTVNQYKLLWIVSRSSSLVIQNLFLFLPSFVVLVAVSISPTPDLIFLLLAIQQLSQFLGAPTVLQMQGDYRILRYLKGSVSSSLFFPTTHSFQLQIYVDSIRLAALIQDDQSLVFVFILVKLPFHGNLRSKPSCLEVLLKLSTKL